MVVGFAGVPGVDGFALDADGLLGAAVGGDQGAVQDHIGRIVGLGAVQSLLQVRGLSCEDVDPFGGVAVGRGAGDAVIAAELGDVAFAPEPPQHQDRLPERGQGAAPFGGAEPAALVVQQSGNVVNERAGDVERGTMSNHVEPSGRRDFLW